MTRYGVLAISHGSKDANWVKKVDDAAAGIRLPEQVHVENVFLEAVQGRLIQDGIDRLQKQGVTDLIVIPLFVSEGSTHVDEIRYAMGLLPQLPFSSEIEPFRLNARLHFCTTLDQGPVLARTVYDHIRDLSRRPREETVLLIGHGSDIPGYEEKWHKSFAKIAGEVRRLGGFCEAVPLMLLPDGTDEWLADRRQSDVNRTVIVAPCFLSEGYFTRTVIPQRFGGSSYRYNGKALVPHPLLVQWMENQVIDKLHNLNGWKER